MAGHIQTGNKGAARKRRADRAQNVDQRRLAGAIGSDQAEQAPRRHRKTDIVERERAAVTLRNAFNEDRMLRRFSGAWRGRKLVHEITPVGGNFSRQMADSGSSAPSGKKTCCPPERASASLS